MPGWLTWMDGTLHLSASRQERPCTLVGAIMNGGNLRRVSVVTGPPTWARMAPRLPWWQHRSAWQLSPPPLCRSTRNACTFSVNNSLSGFLSHFLLFPYTFSSLFSFSLLHALSYTVGVICKQYCSWAFVCVYLTYRTTARGKWT